MPVKQNSNFQWQHAYGLAASLKIKVYRICSQWPSRKNAFKAVALLHLMHQMTVQLMKIEKLTHATSKKHQNPLNSQEAANSLAYMMDCCIFAINKNFGNCLGKKQVMDISEKTMGFIRLFLEAVVPLLLLNAIRGAILFFIGIIFIIPDLKNNFSIKMEKMKKEIERRKQLKKFLFSLKSPNSHP